MKKVAVIGTGLMGTDIAFTSAVAGFEVLLYYKDRGRSDTALGRIRERLERYVESDRIDRSKEKDMVKHVAVCGSLEETADALIVI